MKYWTIGGIIGLIVYITWRIIGFYFSSNEFFHDSNLLVTSVVGLFFIAGGIAIGKLFCKLKNRN